MVPTNRHGQGARWLLVYTPPGDAERTESYAKLSDAEARRDVIAGTIRTGDYIDPRLGRKLFRVLSGEWLASRSGAESTKQRERQNVELLNRQFGDDPIGELRPSAIKAWQTARAKTCANVTVNLELWTLSAIMQTAVDDDLIRKNPCDKVKRLEVPASKVVPWSLEVIGAILDAHRGRLWSVPALAAGAGLRQGEAFGVGVDDVHFLKRELRVERQVLLIGGRAVFAPPKRNSVGTVPLEPALSDALSAHVAKHEPVEITLPWVAPDAKEGETRTARLLAVGQRGRPLRRSAYNAHHWRPALQSVGITPAGKATGIHRLRHAYASYLIAEGKPLTVVAARIRDHLREVVDVYGHLVEGEQIDGAIASLFRSGGMKTSSTKEA